MSIDNPNAKGAIAELKIATAATCLGVPVLRPMTERGRYDEIGGRLLRVQCKWANVRGEALVVHLRSSYLTKTREVRSVYSAGEIDAVAAYCEELERCYLLPVELIQGKYAIQLRLRPPRNGQRAALHWATEYELPGAIAQLEERRAGSAKAVGSSPTSSTQDRDVPTVVGAHELRNRFGWYLERAAAGEEIRVTRRGRPSVRLIGEAPVVLSPQMAVAHRHKPSGERPVNQERHHQRPQRRLLDHRFDPRR